jgi:hypothetical protein
MIIAMFKQQAEIFQILSSCEIDMSFKRIKDKKIKEVVFAAYLPEHGKSIYLLSC